MHAFGTAPQVTYPLGDYAAKTLGFKKIAIVAEDFTYGHEGAGGFQLGFEGAGGKIVQKLWPPLNSPEYAPYLAAIKSDVDAIYMGFAGSNPLRFLKQYGVEAMKVIQEQRRFWAEEDAREAKKKAEQARTAKRDARLNDAGVGMDRLDEDGNLVEGSLAGARQARRDALRRRKRRRAVIGRGMGRSFHDGRFSGLGGIRSGRRIDQQGARGHRGQQALDRADQRQAKACGVQRA